jgi:hypothetical protein
MTASAKDEHLLSDTLKDLLVAQQDTQVKEQRQQELMQYMTAPLLAAPTPPQRRRTSSWGLSATVPSGQASQVGCMCPSSSGAWSPPPLGKSLPLAIPPRPRARDATLDVEGAYSESDDEPEEGGDRSRCANDLSEEDETAPMVAPAAWQLSSLSHLHAGLSHMQTGTHKESEHGKSDELQMRFELLFEERFGVSNGGMDAGGCSRGSASSITRSDTSVSTCSLDGSDSSAAPTPPPLPYTARYSVEAGDPDASGAAVRSAAATHGATHGHATGILP